MLALALGLSVAWGQSYLIRNYSVDNGLAQDARGPTRAGLAAYDGQEWVLPIAPPGPPENTLLRADERGVREPIWQRWWFIFLVAAGAITIVLGGARAAVGWRHAARLEAQIEQRREAEQEMLAAKQAAEAANRAKSAFLANISHELRTPLNSIIGFSDILLAGSPSDSARHKRFLTNINRSGKHLLAVINDLLDISRIEAGNLKLATASFDLAGNVRSVCDSLAARATEKGLQLHSHVAPEVATVFRGDPVRLRQILINLLDNAIKFTAAGEVAVTVDLDSEDDATAIIRFVVSDTGIGVPEENRDGLFATFSQVDGSVSREFGGTGLGLAIARRLAEMMGGEIGLDSGEGQGSRFWFTVGLTKQPLDGGANGPALRILVAEDNLVNQKVAVAMLERLGHHAVAVASASQAISALASVAYDLVLMDIQMPEIDGLEATRRIRSGSSGALDSAVLIIAMTAHALPGDREKCLAAGMDDYIAKPIRREALAATIANAIRPRQEPLAKR